MKGIWIVLLMLLTVSAFGCSNAKDKTESIDKIDVGGNTSLQATGNTDNANKDISVTKAPNTISDNANNTNNSNKVVTVTQSPKPSIIDTNRVVTVTQSPKPSIIVKNTPAVVTQPPKINTPIPAKVEPVQKQTPAVFKSFPEYELMLPVNYSANNVYPLLVCLHPAGNGKEYVNYLKSLDNENWIIAGANGYKNGVEHTVFLPSIGRSVQEIVKNYKITRVYLSGFSGGGMAAYVIAYFMPGAFAGVISNDGLLHGNMNSVAELKKMKLPKAVLLSGSEDQTVTATDMNKNNKLLQSAGVNTYFMTFSGGHQLAPVENYRKAIKWLEEVKDY